MGGWSLWSVYTGSVVHFHQGSQGTANPGDGSLKSCCPGFVVVPSCCHPDSQMALIQNTPRNEFC